MKIILITIFISMFALQPLMSKENEQLDDGLNKTQENIVKIASFAAQGNLQDLTIALNNGLDSGMTINETKEVLVHLYAYCGFPRSIMGLRTLLKVLEDRKEKGILDLWGEMAKPLPDTRTKYERGLKTLRELTKSDMNGPKPEYQLFSTEIDIFLKEHLFADIFERDVLSFSQRELITISVITSLGGLDPMLQGHLNISLNVGISPKQLQEFVMIMESTAGIEKSKTAKIILDRVLENR